MSTRHDIPGGWVELEDPKKVTQRKRRPVREAMVAMLRSGKAMTELGGLGDIDPNQLTSEQATQVAEMAVSADLLGVADEITEALIVALVDVWSFGDEVTVDALVDIPGDAYDALAALVAPMMGDLFPDFATPAFGQPVDPKAPGGD